MSFIFKAISSIFGGGDASPPQQQMMQAPPAPAPAAPPPDRSDADIQAAAERARRSYGVGGGRADNSLTGGIGVPSGATIGAITALLGNVGR